MSFDLNVISLTKYVHRVEQRIDDIKDSMTFNYLLMNDAKTEVLPVGPGRHLIWPLGSMCKQGRKLSVV